MGRPPQAAARHLNHRGAPCFEHAIGWACACACVCCTQCPGAACGGVGVCSSTPSMARVRIEPRRALWWICTCTCGVVVMGRVACLEAARALRERCKECYVMLCYVPSSPAPPGSQHTASPGGHAHMASIPTQHKPRHRCADLLLSSGLAARAEIWGKPPPGVTTQECKHPWPAQDDLPHAHARHARCAGTNRAVLRQLSPLAAGIYIILMVPELYILGYVYGVHVHAHLPCGHV